jgi:hypothetical protein
MIVYVLFVHKKNCFKEKSFYYFHKKLKIIKNLKKTKKTFLAGFLGEFFGWVFLLPTLIQAHCCPGQGKNEESSRGA